MLGIKSVPKKVVGRLQLPALFIAGHGAINFSHDELQALLVLPCRYEASLSRSRVLANPEVGAVLWLVRLRMPQPGRR